MATTARRPDRRSRQVRRDQNQKRSELLQQWRKLYGSEAPPKIPSCWLRMGVAYRQQERKYGALSPATKRLLLQYADENPTDQPAPRKKLLPGTVLVREWHGVNHTVTVLDKGCSYQGKLYPSLTAVADAITSAHWSGPQFFGVNAKRAVIRDE